VFSRDLYARRMHDTVYNLKKVCMHMHCMTKHCWCLYNMRSTVLKKCLSCEIVALRENVFDRSERYNSFRAKISIFLANDLGSPYTTYYLPQSKVHVSKYS
jgi:hypothetical protein